MKLPSSTRNLLRAHNRELRPPHKVCPYCFELDHIAGRNHVPHIVVETCQFHHALRTAERFDKDADMTKQPTKVKTVAMALRSIAVTLDAIKDALGRCAEGLRWLADQLLGGKQ